VAASDPQGQALSYTWSLTSTPSGAATPSFSVNGTGSANTTTATFSQAGSYTFLVTITDTGGLSTTSSVTVLVNQVATSLVVSPGSASVKVNSTQQFTATLEDQFGAALTTQPSISWQVTSGTGSIDATGKYTAPATTGAATVQATGAGFSGTATVSVSTTAFAPVTDLKATPGTNGTVTLTWTSTGTTEYFIYHVINGQEFGVNAAFGGTSGPVTYLDGGLTNGTTYVYVVKAVYNGSNLSTDSNVVSATPGAPTPPTITTQPSNVAVALGQSASFTSAATGTGPITLEWEKLITTTCVWVPLDNTNAPGFQVSTTGNSSTLSFASVVAADAGSYYLSATNAAGEVDSNAAILTILSPPTIATAAAGTVSAAGTTAALSVGVSDPQGQALSYTWSLTSTPSGAATPSFSVNGSGSANNTTATFSQAGSYTFLVTATDTGGLSTTSSVTVLVNQVATSLVVSPSSASVTINSTQQFTATVEDQFGTVLTIQPSTSWQVASGVGSIDATGKYTAPATAGAATVQATGAGLTGTATVSVTAPPPTVTTPASATLSAAGTSAALSVGASDPQGQALSYTWSVTSKPSGAATPSFSVNGTGSANNTTATFSQAGSYTFLVTITDTGGLSTTSSVTVLVNQVATSLVVSPPSASVTINSTQQFTATVKDQFGTALATQPTIAWSASSGSITSSGAYKAPATVPGGPVTITATAAGLSGTATVTVTPVTFPPVTDLKATASTPGQVNLSWTSTGTVEYFVYRVVNGQEFGINAAFGSTSGTVTFNVTGLPSGSTQTYVVKAVYNGNILSADSNFVTVVVP
jgi:hypothetical protein